MKKFAALIVLGSMLLLCVSCPTSDDTAKNGGDTDNNKNGDTPAAKTSSVTFFNESSYHVLIHQDAFSGPVLLELDAGQTKKADVRTSDNYGVGSTFPVEYRYRVVDGTDLASGEVWADGIDPNVQLNLVIEENKSYTLQIPQPKNLEFSAAFVKILNTASLQFELRYLGSAFKQAGNGSLPVPTGKTGVYQFSSTTEGKTICGYTVHTSFQSATVPDFTVKNGYIYDFTYNGTAVVKNSEQKIIFK
jgi:hypothetical protein